MPFVGGAARASRGDDIRRPRARGPLPSFD